MEEAWQPGGNQIAVAVSAVGGAKTEAQAGLYLVSATTGQRRRLVPGRADGIHWSPDGNLLYYCDVGEASHPWLFDLAAGRATMLLHTAIAWSSSSPWSPRGDALLLALEEKPRRAYSIAIMTLPNRQLFPLAPVESVYPDPTW
jgi:Tol biopolymer transport system component